MGLIENYKKQVGPQNGLGQIQFYVLKLAKTK
jgi:hypothetical protein